MTHIRAIETEYKGYRFRSRTEARWAVFFDALYLKWEYEPEGFDLDGIRYLPDFHVQDIGWLEIKPAKEPTEEELHKCSAFATHIETMFMFLGAPKLPKVEANGLIQPMDGLCMTVVDGAAAIMFGKIEADPPHSMIDPRPFCWHQRTTDGSLCLWPIPAWEVVSEEEADFFAIYDGILPGIPMAEPFKRKKIDSPDLIRAYKAARSARFEHGEYGAPRMDDWGRTQYGELPY